MIESGKFSDKRILLIDKEQKIKNDRTWCFWEKENGLFESIVYKRWDHLWFHTDDYSRLLTINPYQYKLIKGIDFYKFCFDKIRQHHNIDLIYGNVTTIHSGITEASLTINNTNYAAPFVFNSILFNKPRLGENEYYLLQHFKGWVIETEIDLFNPNEAVLMDFRPSQRNGTSFVYVMPYTKRKALVEYTLFSSSLLDSKEYDLGLEEYIPHQLKIARYKVIEEEFGIIPMTNYRFPQRSERIINIGTAGGQTKGSSGYTFQFIQKHSAAIVNKLVKDEIPVVNISPRRFNFYDSILLNILHYKTLQGKTILSDIFRKNKPQTVLRFLDNESSFTEDLKIISSLPVLPFLKAALKQI